MKNALHILLAALVVSCIGRPRTNEMRERAYRANNLGVALLEQFNYSGAADAFREALRIDGTLALGHVNLGIALLYVPDLENAAKEATEAARLMPAAPQPWYVLGLIAREQNRDADALQMFERVLRMDPHDTGSAINIGQIHLQQRKYAEAIGVLRRVVGEEPYNVTASYTLGLALTRAGQADEGRRMLERSQALRNTGYSTTLSPRYLEQGRYAEALASTGAEPDLVDATTPATSFAAVAIVAESAAEPMPSPFGRRFANDLSGAGARRLAESLGGGITLFDVDGDGDLDLFVARAGTQRLFRNDGAGRFSDVTAGSGLESTPADAVAIGCVAGDIDNDGRTDLFVLRYGISSLYHNEGGGRFSDMTTRAGLRPYPFLPGAAALVDVDHDGDLDLLIAGLADLEGTRAAAPARPMLFPREFAPAPLRLLRNNGNSTFTDITSEARLDVMTHAVGLVPTDFDNRRDIDLLVVNADRSPLLFKNERDGTFREVSGETSLAAVIAAGDEITTVAAGDANKDGYPDFFFGRRAIPGVLASSDGRDHFTATASPEASRGVLASQFFDYDNDGLLDLIGWSDTGPRLFRNVGRGWVEATGRAFARSAAALPIRSAHAMAVGDVDEDGNTDVVTQTPGGGVFLFRNGGDARHRFVRVRLKGRVSNRSAAGATVQLRAGSLSQRLETSAATPAVAPADLVFGLGDRPGADVVRVLWPSGILQAEYGGSPPDRPISIAATSSFPPTVVVEELDRKPSSCPFLYTWNGERFEFVTDFMGAGEMGYWEAPGERNRPHPIEYVRIRGDQLRSSNGKYEIRVTNELEEALFVDRLQLISIDHPVGIDVFPSAGMTDPPKAFQLYAVTAAGPVLRALDDHGHDVTDAVARLDRQYPDDFELKPIRGYASEHALSVDLGVRREPAVLLLTGWTDYAFSSDNVAAHQAGWALKPPALEVKDARGKWATRIADIGIPIGRPQTIALDLSNVLKPGEHEVRIRTNMRIYWDQVLVATLASSDHLRIERSDPRTAVLRERGFSAEVQPGGKGPIVYDYSQATTAPMWKTMAGRYTRTGDVRSLLVGSEDMFVVSKPGDEIAISFDAPVRGVADGWTRTFLLLADGFSKEMDINSASPDRVEPLPFHGMTRYPYFPPERYPDDAEHERYRVEFNTRVVPRN